MVQGSFRLQNRKADVYVDGRLAGHLTENGRQYSFQYADSWLQLTDAVPVSLTMPLRPTPFVTEGLHPFFENLLPEGWLLELATGKLKISKDDAFGLLMATCADCVGAVEIFPEGFSASLPEHEGAAAAAGEV
jgi:serine/threonine-protein kinase HipA